MRLSSIIALSAVLAATSAIAFDGTPQRPGPRCTGTVLTAGTSMFGTRPLTYPRRCEPRFMKLGSGFPSK
jgi:hypothetical protein